MKYLLSSNAMAVIGLIFAGMYFLPRFKPHSSCQLVLANSQNEK